MIPRIASRGHSFKGAGLYYLHDKEASTSERVAWTEIRNMPTDNPEAATKLMAYTAIHSNRIKQEAGIPLTGRKRKKGVVYTFSLSWSPEENPDRELMLKSADETLELLGLQDHQSLIVAHSDTKHPHVHVICNLINPNDGRMHDPDWGSKLKMSDWSLKHEFENGKVYCEQRVENHEKRKRGELVKYKEPLHDRKSEIQQLYRQSDSGKAFSAALEEKGYTLAKGNRRSFVLVDYEGRVHSLSRQLDKDQKQEYIDKLADLSRKDLPFAKEIQAEREYFDRDKQEREQLERIEDAAIEKARLEQESEQNKKSTAQSQETREDHKADKQKSEQGDEKSERTEAVYKRFDRLKKWEQEVDRKRAELKKQMAKTYGREKQVNLISDLEKQIAANDNFIGRTSGQLKKLKDELAAQKLTLEDIDKRIAEQTGKLEKEISESKPADYWGEGDKKEQSEKEQNQDVVIDLEAERQRKKDAFKEQLRPKTKDKPKDKDRDDRTLGR